MSEQGIIYMSTLMARIGLFEHSRKIQPALIGGREDGERTGGARAGFQRGSTTRIKSKGHYQSPQEADRRVGYSCI